MLKAEHVCKKCFPKNSESLMSTCKFKHSDLLLRLCKTTMFSITSKTIKTLWLHLDAVSVFKIFQSSGNLININFYVKILQKKVQIYDIRSWMF